ncbi:MAG: hypothetical protein U9P70_04875 [Patescibacteria group bacterium]|nr:hypothetical protein [Patescibacteria group bacterium]
MIISCYAHEAGHYVFMKHYFPNADSIRFAWTRLLIVPVPRAVVSENLNRTVTVKQALVVFSVGPIAGFIAMVILSYFLLDMIYIIVLAVGGLLESSGDFKKIYETINEELEKRKVSQGT